MRPSRREVLRYAAFGMVAAATSRGRAAAADSAIVKCVIHPAIGIARVGNSPTGIFVGPEVPGSYPWPDGGFKDSAGRMKRQAARFRIYGLDRNGQVVQEITAEDAEITWTVRLANRKAAWYEFTQPLDISELNGTYGQPTIANPLRNATVADRSQLVIDPGPRSIAGRNTNIDGGAPPYLFDSGRFFGTPVPLGELRTDSAGRLLVLGGMGHSGPAVPGTAAVTFANNDGWHDDVSDGPVDAVVRLDGRELHAEGAWVVVAPPNFGPGLQGVVTMYDVLFDVAARLEPERTPSRPSFTRQIYPLLERHVLHQWVNAGFARDFGWGAASNFLAPENFARLADPSPASRFLRTEVFRRFRNPSYVTFEGTALPPYYGDATSFDHPNPRVWMAVLPRQYGWLEQWAAGDFDADWPAGGLIVPQRIDDVPISEQPAALDRAALDDCLGGPFHPGCEMTWPMRHPSLYAAPFRLRRRSGPEPDWGPVLTSEVALASNGPLAASGPGDITRWMAVPWQTDTSSCLAAYQPEIDDYLPAFWPARVPNDVLSWENYQTVLNVLAPLGERQRAFVTRDRWQPYPRWGQIDALTHINQFVDQWWRYGVVTRQRGPGAPFPSWMWVETGRSLPSWPGPGPFRDPSGSHS